MSDDDYTIDDVLRFIADRGVTGLADVVEDLKLEHGAARAENERLLAFRADEDAKVQSLESKARLVEKLMADDSDFVVVDRRRNEVVGRDRLQAMLEEREPRREPAEQRVEQQPRSLLGGGGFE